MTGIGRRTGEMLGTEGLRTVQRKVLFDDDREPKTQKIEIKQRQRPRDIDENVWNSIPLMFRRKYYKKSRQLNPALVQRKTILPVPLVLIPWYSASSRLRYSRSSEITRGRDQQWGQTSRLRIQSKTISLRSDLIRTIIKIIIKLAVIHSSGTGGRTVVVSGGWNVGQPLSIYEKRWE